MSVTPFGSSRVFVNSMPLRSRIDRALSPADACTVPSAVFNASVFEETRNPSALIAASQPATCHASGIRAPPAIMRVSRSPVESS